MKLQKYPKPITPIFQQVKETPEVVQALADEAKAVGISSTEAIRQIIAGFNARPFTFTKGKTKGRKTAVWSNIKTDQDTIDLFTAHTTMDGVSVAEGIRQCVRRYLKKPGRSCLGNQLIIVDEMSELNEAEFKALVSGGTPILPRKPGPRISTPWVHPSSEPPKR